MHTVALRLRRSAEFSTEIIKIRSWLDSRGCSSFRFKHDWHSSTILVMVEFAEAADAYAFTRHFEASETDLVSPPALQGTRETMEQVCWWRLMAEEILAEADQFASETAKETMVLVARSYERLADDLEKRLANPRYRNGLIVG